MLRFRKLASLLMTICLLFVFWSEAGAATAKQPVKNILTIHYKRPANDYTNWTLWVWQKGKDGQEYKFTKKDTYGRTADIQLDPSVTEVGFIVKRGNWTEKDIQGDRFIKIKAGTNTVWIQQGDPNIYTKVSAVPAKKPAVPTKNVTFKYYSSTAKQVFLNCSYNNWALDKMVPLKRDGNWFVATVPIVNKSQYYFLVDGRWDMDPFNVNRSYGDIPTYTFLNTPAETNVTTSVSIFTSDNFDYFTANSIDKTPDLEKIYQAAMRLLQPFNPKKAMPKIRYYALQYIGDVVPFCYYETSEIGDLWDCSSSHEIIHALVFPHNRGFAEGFAQCYQIEGNQTMREQNANLACNQLLLNYNDIDLQGIISASIKSKPESYLELASFTYYNIFTMNKPNEYAKFLKSLSFDDTYSKIVKSYKAAMGIELDQSIEDWKAWLLTINESSDIYVQWE